MPSDEKELLRRAVKAQVKVMDAEKALRREIDEEREEARSSGNGQRATS